MLCARHWLQGDGHTVRQKADEAFLRAYTPLGDKGQKWQINSYLVIYDMKKKQDAVLEQQGGQVSWDYRNPSLGVRWGFSGPPVWICVLTFVQVVQFLKSQCYLHNFWIYINIFNLKYVNWCQFKYCLKYSGINHKRKLLIWFLFLTDQSTYIFSESL